MTETPGQPERDNQPGMAGEVLALFLVGVGAGGAVVSVGFLAGLWWAVLVGSIAVGAVGVTLARAPEAPELPQAGPPTSLRGPMVVRQRTEDDGPAINHS
jgi:hypothetical protein